VPAQPGVAFSLVKKLLAFNDASAAAGGGGDPLAQRPGLGHAGVPLGAALRPADPARQFHARPAALALPAAAARQPVPLTHLADVRAALDAGVPAAQVYPQSVHASDAHPHEVRIAFDGDAVLFSDEAERVLPGAGAERLPAARASNATQPLAGGPFKPLLEALHRLQAEGTSAMRIRTALVTARSAPAHERAIRTLMDWNIEVDEALFLGGLPKGEFLREFEPDFFFDDQTGHIESAALHVPAGHVASGISND
jgi:5'-nucleotidase